MVIHGWNRVIGSGWDRETHKNRQKYVRSGIGSISLACSLQKRLIVVNLFAKHSQDAHKK